MLRLFLFIFTAIVAQSLNGQSDSLSTSAGKDTVRLNFEKYSYDLGDVKKGEVKYFDIKFKNTGNVPVEIDFVSSCDCTEVEYPMEEIKPGETGILKVKFDSSSKEESETTGIDVFLRNKDPETGSQVYYTLEYSFNLIK